MFNYFKRKNAIINNLIHRIERLEKEMATITNPAKFKVGDRVVCSVRFGDIKSTVIRVYNDRFINSYDIVYNDSDGYIKKGVVESSLKKIK